MKKPRIYYLILISLLSSCACDSNKYGVSARNAWAEYMRISPLSVESTVSECSFIADKIDAINNAYPNSYVSAHLNRVSDWSRRVLQDYQNARTVAANAYNQVRANGEPLKDAGQFIGEATTPEGSGFLAKPVRGLIGRGIVDLANQAAANHAYNEAGSAALAQSKQEYERIVLDEHFICARICYPITPLLDDAVRRILSNEQ